MLNENILEFLKTIQARREHCQNLLDLSRQQQGLITENDYTQLLVVLGKKQRILGRMDELKPRHVDFVKLWHEQRDTLDSAVREKCEIILAEIESILGELLETENVSAGDLMLRRDDTKQKLEAVSRGTQTHDAYRETLGMATTKHLDVNG